MSKSLFKSGAGTARSVGHTLGLLFLLASLPAWADTPSVLLSEQEALRLGLNRPEVIQLLESTVDLAQSDIVEAGMWPNPELSFGQENSTDGPEDVTDRSYMLSQQFDLSGQRAIKTEAAKQRLEVVNHEISQWQLERTAIIKQKFYGVLYRQELHEIFSKWRLGIDAMEVVMGKRKAAGDISGYDLSRLKREQAFVQASQRQTHAEHDRLTQELLAIIGLVGNETPLPGVQGSLLPETSPMPLDKLLERLATQPALLAMDLQSKAYATDERLAKRRWLSELTIGLGVKDTDAAEGDAFLLNLSVPIPVFDANSADRQRAKANQRQLQNKYSMALSEREGLIRGLWNQAIELVGVITPLASDKSCLLLVQTAEVAYQAGEIGVLEILDAYRSAFENQSQILSLMLEARLVRIELDLITGGNTQ